MKTLWVWFLAIGVGLSLAACAAADWPQWRGPNRDARATDFKAPASWPKELTQKLKVTVGDGVATPALVGNKLYVFARQGGDEVLRCLDAETGKEVWKDQYGAKPASGAAGSFPGPRSSPAVGDGKVVAISVQGVLSCYDAASGKKLWTKTDYQGSVPRFFTSSSPLIVGGMCIVQLGSDSKGAMVSYDLTTGNEKWKWTGDGTAYASPVLDTVDGKQEVVTETAKSIVGISLSDGKLAWQTPFSVRYNAATPIVDGTTVYYSGMGKGTFAIKLEKSGAARSAKEYWANNENAVQFNTPVLKDGFLYGISEKDRLFCINAADGKTAWTAPAPSAGGRNRGYGSVVDAGCVLLALTPAGQLIVFEPNGMAFKQIASYKVADGGTFAYPVLSGNRIYIKDRDSVALWTLP